MSQFPRPLKRKRNRFSGGKKGNGQRMKRGKQTNSVPEGGVSDPREKGCAPLYIWLPPPPHLEMLPSGTLIEVKMVLRKIVLNIRS